jgi:hypothetical protein
MQQMQRDNSLFAGMEKRAAELLNVLRRKKKSRDQVQLSPVYASASGIAAPFVSQTSQKDVTLHVIRHTSQLYKPHATRHRSHVTQVTSSAHAFLELGRRQSIMRAYTSSINCQWMAQALGCSSRHHYEQQQQQQQQQQLDPVSFPPLLTLSNENIGCLRGPIVRCMQVAEFVQVSQINACALALSCLLKVRDGSGVSSAALAPPSLSTTAEIFHRFGVPG